MLYPWREALELLLDQESGDDPALVTTLERVQGDIEAHEDLEEESPVYSRFCGDA